MSNIIQNLNPLNLPWTPIKWKQALPPCCGIYFAVSEGNILYIGRSSNLSRRWLNHHKLEEIMVYPDVRLAWMEVSDESLVEEIEKALIKHFNPPLNGRIVSPDGGSKRSNRFEMRLNDEEMQKLQRNAEVRGISVSEFVRDWIKSLPQETEGKNL